MNGLIIWIHGAFSTEKSFNYLRSYVSESHFFNHSSRDLPMDIKHLETLVRDLRPRAVIGHSLGGIMAGVIAGRTGIRGISITSPLAGFRLGALSFTSPLLFHTSAWSPVIRELGNYHFDDSFLNITASIPNRNHDGVVPYRSQIHPHMPNTKKVDGNHFEVLLDPNVGKLITSHLAA